MTPFICRSLLAGAYIDPTPGVTTAPDPVLLHSAPA